MTALAASLTNFEMREPDVPTGWVLSRTVRAARLGGCFVLLIGLGFLFLLQERPAGLILSAAGAVGLVFLPRRGITSLICLGVAADGALHFVLPEGFGPVELIGGVAAAGLALVPVAPRPNAPAEVAAGTIPIPGESVNEGDEVPDEVPEDRAPAREAAPLTVRTIGQLELRTPDGDVTGEMRRYPAQAFIWLYLLASSVAGSPRITRTKLAQEFNPKVGREDQLARLRKRLSDIQSDLPPALSKCVVVDRTHVTLDLNGADFDVARLRTLRAETAAAGDLIGPELAAAIENELTDLGTTRFLPEWEEIEDRQTRGLGEAQDVVEVARQVVDSLRADLALALAQRLQASGDPAKAIPLLTRTLESNPGREDVARRLIALYLATGQTAAAASVQRSYQTSEV